MSIKTNCYSLGMCRQFSSLRRYYERRVTSDEGGFAIYTLQAICATESKSYIRYDSSVLKGKVALLARLKPRLAFW